MNAHTLVREEPPAASEIVINDPLAALSPSQAAALAEIERIAQASPIVGLTGPAGIGKSTILRAFVQKHNATVIDVEHLLEALELRDVESGSRAVFREFEARLAEADILVVDNLRTFTRFVNGLSGSLVGVFLRLFMSKVRLSGKRFIFTASTWDLDQYGAKVQRVAIEPFDVEDYRAILASRMGRDAIAGLDVETLFETAGGLNGRDLAILAAALREQKAPSTQDAVAALLKHVLRTNVRTEQVEALSFASLPGAEHIAAKLETHIILPLEHPELARELDIRPKRGVLLYGPPGTGKTSIGRALAHRMQGKFFLIDGSFSTDPPTAFFGRVKQIVEDAIANAPCVLFVDDADVLFDIVNISGFARYLLSMLDGMESESVDKVCLMMTAMDASKVPSAILRSGRVELWLETRPPDVATRAEILKRWRNDELPGAAAIDYMAVAERAENFNPADLRRVMADAMAYFAADEVAGRPTQTGDAYLVRAIEELIATRKRMAELLHDDSLRLGGSKNRDKYAMGIGGLVEASSSCSLIGW
ncbi:ATP-binding protein [Sphingomonas sp.]|uniref:ATP-binding protein n=1 Tax=Sphingomonas sp. TaxID=28214 RepID=UPI002600ED89|nr:ATP-binding protein [Sphingomonas sp.]